MTKVLFCPSEGRPRWQAEQGPSRPGETTAPRRPRGRESSAPGAAPGHERDKPSSAAITGLAGTGPREPPGTAPSSGHAAPLGPGSYTAALQLLRTWHEAACEILHASQGGLLAKLNGCYPLLLLHPGARLPPAGC